MAALVTAAAAAQADTSSLARHAAEAEALQQRAAIDAEEQAQRAAAAEAERAESQEAYDEAMRAWMASYEAAVKASEEDEGGTAISGAPPAEVTALHAEAVRAHARLVHEDDEHTNALGHLD